MIMSHIKHPSHPFRSDTKSNLFPCLEKSTPKVHNLVLDGPVIVHLLKPIGADTFEDGAQQVLLRYVTSQRTSRIEVI